MAYNHRQIFAKLDAALSQSPDMQLGKFAQYIRVERHTIEKVVRETTGLCFREYKKQILLEKARRLLIEEYNLSEKEIAFKLGYKSPDAFYRFIKINTGRCPSDIRRHVPL